jgi:hypothetical protein
MMKLIPIEGNRQKLDGGAMYGNAPKAMWEAWSPPDEKNRITFACRALLLRDDDGRNILFEAGIGAFLVGEAFMRAADPGVALAELFS